VIRFHDIRHTATSIMLSHGITPILVAGMLGHSLAILRPAMLALLAMLA
jgi:integrase